MITNIDKKNQIISLSMKALKNKMKIKLLNDYKEIMNQLEVLLVIY